MKKEPSIYEYDGKTIVAFGTGSIQIGVSTDDHGQAMVYLSDVLRENPIGGDESAWETPEGRQIVLGFNKVGSIDVLLEALNKAKAHIAHHAPRK